MEIVYAEVVDAATILALQRAAYQAEAKLYDDPHLPPLRQTLVELIAEFDTHVFLKAVVDGDSKLRATGLRIESVARFADNDVRAIDIDFSHDCENILRADVGSLVELGARQLVRSPHQPAIA